MTETKLLRPYSYLEDLHPLIAGRWSSRAFDKKKVPSVKVMERLFEAARWAPSAMNSQPWRFLSFGPEDPDALDKARDLLNSGNFWARSAPRLLFVLTRKNRPGGQVPNRLAQYEAGMAAAQMALQAMEEGLVFHQMAGFDRQGLFQSFSLSEDFEALTAVALGYPGLIEEVPSEKRELETSERERKELESLVFSNGALPEK